jgi:hypothetical protein
VDRVSCEQATARLHRQTGLSTGSTSCSGGQVSRRSVVRRYPVRYQYQPGGGQPSRRSAIAYDAAANIATTLGINRLPPCSLQTHALTLI